MEALTAAATSTTDRRQQLLCLLSIIVAVFVAHGTTLLFDYVWEDWNSYLAPNPAQQLRNLPRFFLSSAQEGFGVSHSTPYYRPVSVLFFGIEYALVGATPFWNHLISVALHATNAVILFFIAQRLLPGSTWPAVAASLIFAVHPAMTESIAYLGGRGDLICALFMGSSFLVYLRFRQEQCRWCLTVSQLLLALALLAKEMAVVMPLLILLYELRSTNRRHLLYALIPAAVTIVYLSVRANVLPVQSWTTTPLAERIYTCIYVVGHYLLTLCAPLQIRTLYDVTTKFSLLQREVLLMLVVIAGYLLLMIVAYLRRQRLLAALLLGVLLLLFPVSNLPGMILPSPMAARYLYLPAHAFCLAAGVAITLLLGKMASSTTPQTNRLQPFVLGVLCLVLAGITVMNSGKWRNNDIFFATMLREAPHLPLSYKFAGNYFGKTGRGAEMAQLNQQAYEVTKLRQLALAEELLKFRQYDRAAFEVGRIMNAEGDPRIMQLLATIRSQQGKTP